MTRPLADETWSASAGQPPDWPMVPGYEILGELGRGGMGVVYKARQVSSERLVALKLIRDGALAGPQTGPASASRRRRRPGMRHPNVVQIYEVGEHRAAVLRHGVRRGRQPRPAPRRPAAARAAGGRAGPHPGPGRPARPRADRSSTAT